VKWRQRLAVKPRRNVRLADLDPAGTFGWEKGAAAEASVAKAVARLDELQYLMYAERRHALLVVLQGIDGAGKDGTIRHVMTGLNPQGCRVTSFKQPSAEEAAHDFLWRVHRAVPPLGDVGIFNRSHYEDVLVARVHELVPKKIWSARYDAINDFEAELVDAGVTIVKCFLHISKREQKRRFAARLEDKDKQWKLSLDDFEERRYWDDYQRAFEDALTRCSTKAAPWYVIPSDHKWVRNLAISHLLVEVLEGLDMKFPKPAFDPSQVKLE
jgi:PPK2 family polyphosphate:nucleotide phosphotransferase